MASRHRVTRTVRAVHDPFQSFMSPTVSQVCDFQMILEFLGFVILELLG